MASRDSALVTLGHATPSADALEPLGEHACLAPRSLDLPPTNLNHQAGLSAVSFRTHALLGAAAVFGAVLAQPSAVGYRARVEYQAVSLRSQI